MSRDTVGVAVGRKFITGVSLGIWLAGSVVLLAGCASSGTVEESEKAPWARQITQSAHCGLTGPGLAYVQNSGQLQDLLELPAQNMAVQQLRQVDLEQEHLLFVTLGKKSTGGYSASLDSVSAASDTGGLQLAVKTRSPAPGAVVTQAITSPCVVVAVPARDWPEIRVSGIGDEDLVLAP